jgi:transcriptional regulator with XRE-family HTH domain
VFARRDIDFDRDWEERQLRLTEERERRGWSKAELARRAGINATTVSLIENGRFHPYPEQLSKLALALDWPTSEAAELVKSDVPQHRDQ